MGNATWTKSPRSRHKETSWLKMEPRTHLFVEVKDLPCFQDLLLWGLSLVLRGFVIGVSSTPQCFRLGLGALGRASELEEEVEAAFPRKA